MQLRAASTFFPLALAYVALVLQGCGSGKDQEGKKLTNPNQGAVTLMVDETFKPILQQLVATYHEMNPETNITIHYVDERTAINAFYADSVEVVLVPSYPDTAQLKQLQERARVYPKFTALAADGIVALVHPEQADTNLTMDELRAILLGKTTNWSELGGPSQAIKLVFDQANSSLVRYMQDSLLDGQAIEAQLFAADSNLGVIDVVAKTKGALGFVGFNYLSDGEDPIVQERRASVQMVALPDSAGKPVALGDQFSLYRMVNGDYPLQRKLWAWNREGRTGLGTGFVNFCAGQKGQRIIAKAELAPLQDVIRLVEVKDGKLEGDRIRTEGDNVWD